MHDIGLLAMGSVYYQYMDPMGKRADSVMIETPYLIQLARIAANPAPTDNLSKAVQLEDMGRSEFEFGTMPASLRSMHARAVQGTINTAVVAIEAVVDRAGRPLLALGIGVNPDDVAQYRVGMTAIVDSELANQRSSTFVSARFEDVVKPMADLPSYHPLKREPPKGQRRPAARAAYRQEQEERLISYWWDLGNGVMMSFDPEFMARLPLHLDNSWESMGLSRAFGTILPAALAADTAETALDKVIENPGLRV